MNLTPGNVYGCDKDKVDLFMAELRTQRGGLLNIPIPFLSRKFKELAIWSEEDNAYAFSTDTLDAWYMISVLEYTHDKEIEEGL